jgi:uncharacterized protein involved in response to NO
MPAVAPAGARPAGIDPYRVLFPMGVACALGGAILWPLFALGWIPYPGPLHMELMIQGFELCFVMGFFLTAMPAFTHGPKCCPGELLAAGGCAALFGGFALAGVAPLAHAAFTAGVATLLLAGGRRAWRNPVAPPEEFQFVGLGLALGVAGGALLTAVSSGWLVEPAPRLGIHLVSLGMVLSLVLGLGGLLVPTFTMMPQPLFIPGIARPGERAPRRRFYLPLTAALLAAFGLEALGWGAAAAWIRAGVGTALLLLVWKLFRLPGKRDVPGFAMWGSGWMILAGLWAAALDPVHGVAAYHLVFIGGYGLLTMGIATRVVVTHGGYSLAREKLLLPPPVAIAVLGALAARLAAEVLLGRSGRAYVGALGVSGGLWVAAWAWWAWRAVGPLVRRQRVGLRVGPAGPGPRR